MFQVIFDSKVVEYMRGLTSTSRPKKKPKEKPPRRDPSLDSLDCAEIDKATTPHKKVSKKKYNSDTNLYRRAVELHRKTLELIFKGSKWAAREAGIVNVVNSILAAIVTLKAKFEKVKTAVKYKVKLRKSTRRDGAVMDLNPRHHKTKYHITTEQRDINKVKDGVLNREENKATLLQVSVNLLAKGVQGMLGYKANPTPTPRKQRNQFARELKKYFKKPKYPPQKKEECLLLAA